MKVLYYSQQPIFCSYPDSNESSPSVLILS